MPETPETPPALELAESISSWKIASQKRSGFFGAVFIVFKEGEFHLLRTESWLRVFCARKNGQGWHCGITCSLGGDVRSSYLQVVIQTRHFTGWIWVGSSVFFAVYWLNPKIIM